MTRNQRKTTRIDIEVNAAFLREDGSQVQGISRNISFASVWIDGFVPKTLLSGERGVVVLYPAVLENMDHGLRFEAVVSRLGRQGFGLQLLSTERASYRHFKKMLLEKINNPLPLLREIHNNPDLSMSLIHVGFMRAELAGLIRRSVEDLFQTFLMGFALEVRGDPSEEGENNYQPPVAEVTGVIHYNGAITGGVHLACTEKTALMLAGALADISYQSIEEEEAVDAFGELVNIVAGGVQTHLLEEFENIDLTPPSVVVGSDYGIVYQSNLNRVQQTFVTVEQSEFMVECFFSF
ncbi:chemotaxis protein CheX [Magnetococcales bacterium HHB-1]